MKMTSRTALTLLSTVLASLLRWGVAEAGPRPGYRLDFGPGELAAGHRRVLASTVYGRGSRYGFEPGQAVSCFDRGVGDALGRDLCTAEGAFSFSLDVPEGNYRVTVTLGDPAAESLTTVRAESRRLMLEGVHVDRGSLATRRFLANVRNSRIAARGEVRLKEREKGALHWDDKLTLEFSGSHPSLAALEVERVDDAVTVYLAGDSTVTDQTREPWAAWGQMLPRFFGPGVAIANHAESGEALLGFRAEGRWAKILSQIRPGDYLFLQFAHNDQKPGPDHLEPFAGYKQQLRSFVEEARGRGAIPVLVTSMPRRSFDGSGRIVNTLGDYPDAMRQLAREERVALVDLNAAAKAFFEALGPEGSKRAFVHYPAGSFPGQQGALADDSHFSSYGAYQLARAVAAGIAASGLDLARHLIDAGPFDPREAAAVAPQPRE